MLIKPSTPVPLRLIKQALAGIIIVSSASVASVILHKGLEFSNELEVDTAASRIASITGPTKVHAQETPVKKTATKSTAKEAYFIKPAQGKDWGIIHAHNGVDFANKCGTSIVAAAAGTVTSIDTGWNGGYGTAVQIKHKNGMETYYAHMATVAIEEGANVEQGDQIGTIGITGKATGCHVHFEVHGGTNPFGK